MRDRPSGDAMWVCRIRSHLVLPCNEVMRLEGHDSCCWFVPAAASPVSTPEPQADDLLRRALERLAAANAAAGPDEATDRLLIDICAHLDVEAHPDTIARAAASGDPAPEDRS